MKNFLPAVLFIFGVSVIYYAFSKKNETASFQNVKTPTLKATPAGVAKPESQAPEDHHHAHHEPSHAPTAALVEAIPPTRSITAITKMSSLLKNYAFKDLTMNDVIDDLEKQNMSPLLLKDANPYTGTMYVLRTDSPLPGTRYFHAQYFTDGKKQPFLQHMSFDVKPDKNAFSDSIGAIKKIFGKLRAPTIIKKDFIMWPWKKGYNIWIKKMNSDDLEGDPYNAYDSSDAGTIKIAVEMDIHH